MFRSLFSTIIGIFALAVLTPVHGYELTSNPDFLPAHEAFKVSATGTPDSVVVRILAAPGYYLYKSKLSFRTLGQGVLSGAAVLPAGEQKNDPYFGDVVVYHGALDARVPVRNHGAEGFELRVGFQGCAEKGLCYPPDEQTIHIDRNAGVTAASGWSGFSVASAFISGLVLFLTPGVLPVVPLLLFLLVIGESSIRRGLTVGLAFTAPMAAGIVVFNTVMALTTSGTEIQSIAQSFWVLVPSVIVLLGLAALVGGIAKNGRDGDRRQTRTLRALITSTTGAALLGLVSLIYTTPFTSSSTAAVIMYLKAGGEPLGGIAQLGGLALGMVSPLLLIALTVGRLLPVAGKWKPQVTACARVMLAIVAVWVLARVLPGAAALGLYGLVSVGSAAALGVFESLKSAVSLPTRTAAVLLLMYGAIAWVGMLKGESSSLQPMGAGFFQAVGSPEQPWLIVTTPQQLATALTEAKTAGTPALVEWAADWAPGSDQVAVTSRNVPLVSNSLRAFKAIRVDLTHGGQSARSLLELNGLFGPAGVQIYSSDGVEVQSARLVGVAADKAVLASLQAVHISSVK